MSDATIEYKDLGLKNLIKAMKNIPHVRVGVLGDKNSRPDGGSNAEIGLKHEFGQEGMPVRSFLRMPISTKLQTELEKNGALQKEALMYALKQGNLSVYLKNIGATAVEVVLDAFATGGFGQWKPSNMEHKTVQQTLVETTALRESIISQVVE